MADILITDLRGGRNGVDSPIQLPANQCREMLNVELADGPLGSKRNGSEDVDTTGNTPFTLPILKMFRHMPDGKDENAELWAIDVTKTVRRLRSGTTWEDITLDDAITGEVKDVRFASLNGKLFMSYKSAVDRLHVFDPAVGVVRRVGLAKGGAPVVADHGAGAFTCVKRYFRVRFIQKSGTKIVRRSEPSASVSITPSGGGTDIRISVGALPGERETHWEIEASQDDGVYFVLYGEAATAVGAAIPIATGFQDDHTSDGDLLTMSTSEEIGSFQLVPSVKFVRSDGNRLLLGNSFENGPTSRMFFTPVLGSSDHGDDERLVITDVEKGFIDLNEKDGGEITAISDPVQGLVFTFKYRQTIKLTPTGDPSAPYLPKTLSSVVGCLEQDTVMVAEDHVGNPLIAYCSHLGPYRVGPSGMACLSRDIEDIWFGPQRYQDAAYGPINLEANIVAHGLFYPERHQVLMWLSVGDTPYPNLRVKCDVRQALSSDQFGVRGGWTVDDGTVANACCSALYAEVIDINMSKKLVPYVGRSPGIRANAGSLVMTGKFGTWTWVSTASTLPYELGRILPPPVNSPIDTDFPGVIDGGLSGWSDGYYIEGDMSSQKARIFNPFLKRVVEIDLSATRLVNGVWATKKYLYISGKNNAGNNGRILWYDRNGVAISNVAWAAVADGVLYLTSCCVNKDDTVAYLVSEGSVHPQKLTLPAGVQTNFAALPANYVVNHGGQTIICNQTTGEVLIACTLTSGGLSHQRVVRFSPGGIINSLIYNISDNNSDVVLNLFNGLTDDTFWVAIAETGIPAVRYSEIQVSDGAVLHTFEKDTNDGVGWQLSGCSVVRKPV